MRMMSIPQLSRNLCPPFSPISHLRANLGPVSSTHARDDGIRRVSSITRWVAALGVAATGFFAAFVYRSAPGKSTVSTPAAGAASADAGSNTGSAPADPTAGGFQAPAVAPTPVYQAPMVRSGAS
jgi:hypothetical protein